MTMAQRLRSYKQISSYAEQLYREKQYKTAAEYLEDALKKFFRYDYDVIWDLIILYGHTGSYERICDLLELGLKKGYWYPIFQGFKKLRNKKRFKKIISDSSRLKAMSQQKAKSKFYVHKPLKYSKNKKYPLFIVLHGANSSIRREKRYWRSKKLYKNYILAFMQSSQVRSSKTFGWHDLNLACVEVTNSYCKIITRYPVDIDRIVIAGFSQGASVALEIIIKNLIPAAGFVFCCPGAYQESDHREIGGKKRRRVCGVVIVGEDEISLTSFTQLIKTLMKC